MESVLFNHQNCNEDDVVADIEIEEQRLLPRRRSTYLSFRHGRVRQEINKCTGFVLVVFKVCFCLVGLWGHRTWGYIPRVLFGAVCIYEGFVVFYINLLHECSNKGLNNLTDENRQAFRYGNNVGDVDIVLISVAAIISYFFFIGCFISAKSKDSALVSPSLSMRDDVSQGDMFKLFLAFFIITLLLLLDSFGVFYRKPSGNLPETRLAENSFCTLLAATGVAAQFLLRWVSVNTCHIFAVSSFTLGTFSKDALRYIHHLQNGTLDDIIRIHEELCTVVFNTVSAYSVWFVLHWFSYGASVLVAVIYISQETVLGQKQRHSKPNGVDFGFLPGLLCLLYIFILPCVCAARISSHCAGVYEKINCTTSADWNEGHPFRDRRNIALFISYAKERRCGFKVGRITFNSSLAWFSFFFGLTALFFHFFQSS